MNDELNHANIVIGENTKDFVFQIISEKLNFKTQGNPDFFVFENAIFGIDDARNFETWLISKPFVGEVKVSFIEVKSITHEAQNALLKSFEEPTFGTYIFLGLESLGGLLPTFLSRVHILKPIKIPLVGVSRFNLDSGEKFLKGKIKEKFSVVRSMSKKEDKNTIKDFIKNLEEIAYQNNLEHEDMKKILKAKIFALQRGSSPKMLLEWLTCVII